MSPYAKWRSRNPAKASIIFPGFVHFAGPLWEPLSPRCVGVRSCAWDMSWISFGASKNNHHHHHRPIPTPSNPKGCRRAPDFWKISPKSWLTRFDRAQNDWLEHFETCYSAVWVSWALYNLLGRRDKHPGGRNRSLNFPITKNPQKLKNTCNCTM